MKNLNETKTILIVDDDPEMRDMLVMMLEDAGYHVVSARDGREALSYLDEHQPGLVISDLMMPFLDGWTLYARMQQHAHHRTIPFIAMSALSTKTATQRGDLPDVMMKKPFQVPALLEIVRQMTT